MTTKIIKFFSSFGDPKQVSLIYSRFYNLTNITFTNDENYTHAVILNTATPILTIPKENVIGLAFEPPPFLNLTPEFIKYSQQFIGKYYIGDSSNLPLPFIEGYSFMWHITPPKIILPKLKLMSIMVSDKISAPGHIYRHQLTEKILQHNLPIDIYGRGCKFYKNTLNLKGEFTETEPYHYYLFHICIENFFLPHYFSEKITNPLLCNTIPIYLGCKNINQYFPNTIINLDGNIDKDLNLLFNICKNPQFYIKDINQEKIIKTISFQNIINQF